jgi:ParB family chromosome partitioning protein
MSGTQFLRSTTGQVSSYKKGDLVNSLIRHFQTARAAAAPTPAQQRAREWLPEAMLFPAVDHDAPTVAGDDDVDDDGDEQHVDHADDDHHQDGDDE